MDFDNHNYPLPYCRNQIELGDNFKTSENNMIVCKKQLWNRVVHFIKSSIEIQTPGAQTQWEILNF